MKLIENGDKIITAELANKKPNDHENILSIQNYFECKLSKHLIIRNNSDSMRLRKKTK